MNSQELRILIQRQIDGTISASEYQVLADAAHSGKQELWHDAMSAVIADTEVSEPFRLEDWQERIDYILNQPKSEPAIVHRVHFLRTARFRYAAAIIIVFGLGTYLFVSNQKEKPSVTKTNPNPVQNDVLPGGNRATLTLANGSKIVLDSAMDGVLAQEGDVSITKDKNKIYYKNPPPSGGGAGFAGGGGATAIAYNTITAPRGGQYQLTLPDGSQVWLNAESSITYPTSFTEKERRVAITGEAYFEVAKNKAKPFIVSVHALSLTPHENTLEIEVLGTHFNINSYENESSINTTLLEGSVRLKNSVHTSLILKPGQQGQLKNERLSLAAKPDVEQVMAWKNGVFNFNKVSLADAMKQLSRWYDVEVVYENGKIPDMRFGGKMGRDLKISQVLNGLQAIGVQFKIEGKTLIVRS